MRPKHLYHKNENRQNWAVIEWRSRDVFSPCCGALLAMVITGRYRASHYRLLCSFCGKAYRRIEEIEERVYEQQRQADEAVSG